MNRRPDLARRQQLSIGLLMPVTLLMAGLLAAALAQPVPSIPILRTAPAFDAGRALADAAELRRDYAERVVGSPGHTGAAAWIAERMAGLGLRVETLPFTVTVASQARTATQIWATARGDRDEIILVSAHYDTAPMDTGLPADNAAGVAALLELARALSAEPHRHTLIFMASDSRVYGPAWGAKTFAERFEGRVVAALDLDFGQGDGSRLVIKGAGLRSGYAPVWLREAGLAAAEASGASAVEAQGIAEYALRALPLIFDESGAYLRARVPAISLSSAPGGLQPSPGGMAAFGQAAETWLLSVDALNPVPRESVAAAGLRLSRTHALPDWAVSSLQLLLFAPLFLATAIAWRADRPSTDELKPELYALLGLVIAGLDGYAVAYSLVVAGLLPRYDMLPASPGDPFLQRPDWLAVLLIFGTVAFFAWYTFRRGGWGHYADLLDIPYRRTTLLVALSAMVFFFWQINGYAVSAFLGLPAYLWIWIEPRRPAWGKVLNAALAVAGALPFVLGVLAVIRPAQVGPAWWFITLSAAYGLLPLPAVVAVVIGLALFIRFIRHGLRRPGGQAGIR